MKFFLIIVIVFAVFFSFSAFKTDEEFAVSFFPERPIQGEAVIVYVSGEDFDKVKNITVGSTTLPIFEYQGQATAVFGFDLNGRVGNYLVAAELLSGERAEKNLELVKRERETAVLGIPQKLGGNTRRSQNMLVSSLETENKELASVVSSSEVFWEEPFIVPLSSTTVTDTYGYSRLTGVYEIPHKGTDFRAATGTPVLAMNRGVVRMARNFKVYGNTVVIDHGPNIQTIYMHLSEIVAKEGDLVERGETVGLSGDTGYAEYPHLHVSVRLNGISVDPERFLSLFKE